MKQWFVAFCSLFLLVGTSCKDELTLEDVGSDVYMTITPSNPTLVYGVDTLQMECVLTSQGGKPVTGQVEWVSDDPTIAKFIDGTNKLTAELSGIGKTVKVRAKLANGKYALTTVTVNAATAEGVELLNVKVNEKDEKVVDPETKEEKLTKVYTGAFSFLGEEIHVPIKTSIEFIAKVTPAGVLDAGDIVIEGADAALCTVEKIQLDPEADKGKIAVTPKGAVWYRISSTGVRGSAEITFKSAGRVAKEAKVKVNFGTQLEKIGFNTAMDVVQESKVLNIGESHEAIIYATILPALDEDLEVIRKSAVWSISDTQGGGGIIVGEPTVERGESGILIKATVEASRTPGSFTLSCTVQGKTLAKSFTVIDKSKVPFEKISFEGEGFDDLYAGEAKQLRIRVLPLSSQVYIQDEMQLSYSVADIAAVEPADGLYRVKGLKAGQTELIVTARGREFRLPITVKPAPRSVSIDSRTENVLMLGDQIAWSADVQMEGGDSPVWANLKWSIKEGKGVQIVGAQAGKSIQLKATELTDKVTILADYRGKQSTRDIKVVPLQPSVVLATEHVDVANGGVTTENGAVVLELVSKNKEAQPNIRILMTPKAGAPAIGAKTYTGADHTISVQWSDLNLRKVAVESSSVVLTGSDSGYTAKVNVTMTVDGKQITVTGTISGLEKY